MAWLQLMPFLKPNWFFSVTSRDWKQYCRILIKYCQFLILGNIQAYHWLCGFLHLSGIQLVSQLVSTSSIFMSVFILVYVYHISLHVHCAMYPGYTVSRKKFTFLFLWLLSQVLIDFNNIQQYCSWENVQRNDLFLFIISSLCINITE